MEKRELCEPAKSIVEKFGGPYELAQSIGLHPTAIYYWMWSKSKGGSDGVIPLSKWGQILQAAKQKRLKLKLQDLYGKALP